MHSVPSLDLSSVQIPDDPARPLAEYTVPELKDELIRRGCADFSRWEVLVKLSPFILLFAAVCIYKFGKFMDGSYLGCLLQ